MYMPHNKVKTVKFLRFYNVIKFFFSLWGKKVLNVYMDSECMALL